MTATLESTPAADMRRQWQTQGYVLVRGLISSKEAAHLRVICDHAREEWTKCEPLWGKSVATPDKTNMKHVIHPDFFRNHRDWYVTLMDMIGDERPRSIARAVFGEEPDFCTTTYWFNPIANHRNGNWHRDTQFMTKTDEEEKKMLFGDNPMGIQLQLALVASDDSEVVPGSHLRWDTPEEYAIRKANGLKNWTSDNMPGALRVALQPGDAVGFNSLGLHRGRYHTDKPRRTLMISYARPSGALHHDYFTNQPWLLELGALDGLKPETRAMFERFVAQYREYWARGDKFEPAY